MGDVVTPLRIGYIGGGSRAWAPMLMNDLAQEPRLGGEVRLYDIDRAAAERNARLGAWLQQQPGVVSQWSYRVVGHVADALRGADVVVVSIQPGSLEQMGHELAVAEQAGLFFPVGDTTGAPGLTRGLRAALVYAEFAAAIAEHCPAAWVINYTNPMSVCTRTLTRVAPHLKVFGCCHEVFGTQQLLAQLAQRWYGLPAVPARREIEVNVLGINHFTWIDRASYRGHDLLARLRTHLEEPGVLRFYDAAEIRSRDNWFNDEHRIKFELFRRYGILAAAGDRHLAEFVPGFIGSPDELFRWGIIRTPISYRQARHQQATAMVDGLLSGALPFTLRDSGEEAVQQIAALVGRAELVTNVNLANVGQISNLPLGAVVETNAWFGRDRVIPLAAGALPPGVAALVSRHVAVQEMIVEAALTRDRGLAFQALCTDPTTTLPLDRAWALFEALGLPPGW
jgi:alpha-galactosidase/6-phospho-beta-glucosidase family protein